MEYVAIMRGEGVPIMTAEIKQFTGMTTLDLDPNQILEEAKGELETVFVVGRDMEGMLYVASNTANVGEMMLLMEQAKAHLLRALQEQN